MHHHLSKISMNNESIDFLKFQEDWVEKQAPGVPLVSRSGRLFSWDVFNNDADNYNNNNICVVGKNGSGKSLFMQELMTSTLRVGGRVFVFDVGRNFEKMCHHFDGQFIEFTPQTNLSINPFSKLSNAKKDGLLDPFMMFNPVLATMAAPDIERDSLEYALFKKSVFAVWALKGKETTITDIAEYLKSQNDKKAKDLGRILFPYTMEGAYGCFFEGASNINFDKSLVVIELEELKGHKDLQTIVMQMIIIQIMNQMYLEGRKTPFHIVINEAWDALSGSQMGVFTGMLARRLRQYNGSLVIGAQSINDFYASEGALVAYEESDWMCLLSQEKESIEQLKKNEHISLDHPHMESLLKSLCTKRGQYSEIMISEPYGYSIGRLMLDPFSQTSYAEKSNQYVDREYLQE